MNLQRRFYVGVGGTSPQISAPRFTCCPPYSKASWPFWRDFWGPKVLQLGDEGADGAMSAPPEFLC